MATTAAAESESTEAGGAEPGSMLRRMGGALQRRDFRWWFGAQIASTSGVMAQAVALSWAILRLSDNAVWLSVLVACSWLPMLVLGPWAGALVDRSDRRRVLVVTQILLFGIAAALCVLQACGALKLPEIMGLAVFTGVVVTVDFPARQVYVVDMVGEEAVASAVGLWEVALNAARVLGPGIGGVLLATTGVASCFAANALSYALPLYVLWRVVGKTDRSTAPRLAKSGAIREGLRYALRSPLFRALLPLAAASGLIFGMGVALPPLATTALHLGGGGYGAMMAAFGVGGLPGALIAAASPVPTGNRVRILAVATAASVLAVAWSPDAAVGMIAMALTGFTSIWFISAAQTLAQLRCDPDYRGRVMSLWGMAITGTTPFTGFGVAAVIDYVGPRAGFSVSGVCLALAVFVGWRALRD